LTLLYVITRPLSILAVGAVLLLGGFFYQRLAPRLEDREKSRETVASVTGDGLAPLS
jgi:uncharacterized membrane protein